jgi:hypothetical protein
VPESDSTPSPLERFTFSIIPEWVLDHEKLSHGAVRLYGILARYSDEDGISWPSRSTLARRLRCTPITIDRWAAELVRAEALTITRRKSKNGKHNLTNLWKIHKVVTPVIPPNNEGKARLGSQMMRRTKTSKRKPKKGIAQLLDQLIKEEE